MKKLLFITLLLPSFQVVYSQAVIGTVGGTTDADQVLQFKTNNTLRASWLGSGAFLIGTASDGTSSYPNKVVLHSTDLKMENSSAIFLGDGLDIYSSTTYKSTTTLGYLRLFDGGDGDLYLNSHRIMFLQPNTTTEPVLVCLPTSTPLQTRDRMQVGGTVKADGYVAALDTIAGYDSTSGGGYFITNSDFLVLADPYTSTSGNVMRVRLPVYDGASPVTAGRIFVIKNISSHTGYYVRVDVQGSGKIDGADHIYLSNPNDHVMVQYDGYRDYFIIGN